jgi:hypothetical protein
MYVFIKEQPTKEDIKIFNMKESINDNYINFGVNPNLLSIKDKTTFISKYKLDKKALSYKDLIFLAMPNTLGKIQCT